MKIQKADIGGQKPDKPWRISSPGFVTFFFQNPIVSKDYLV